MAENGVTSGAANGVITRHQAKKLRETMLSSRTQPEMFVVHQDALDDKGDLSVCNTVANRRSYPPDPWTLEAASTDHTVKQRRTLCDRDHNVFLQGNYGQDVCGNGQCQEMSQRSKLPAPHVRGNVQQQSVSAGFVQASKQSHKKMKNTVQYQLCLSSLMPMPATPPPRPEVRVPDDIYDIDAEPDSLDTNCYAKEIMEYLQYLETFGIQKPDFLDFSPEVTTRMRGVLMDWILQVQSHEELKEETLHLCVAFIDHILSVVNVKMSKLQLVGITCLLIASKFRERFAPDISVLCYLTEHTFEPKQVVTYEIFVLDKLDFRLSRPVCHTFLDRYFQVHEHPEEVKHLSNYILDLSITSVAMVPTLPSLKAASALYLSRLLLLDPTVILTWSPALTYYSAYEAEDLYETAKEFAVMLIKAPTSKFQGAREKYRTKEFSCISECDRVSSSWILSRFDKGTALSE